MISAATPIESLSRDLAEVFANALAESRNDGVEFPEMMPWDIDRAGIYAEADLQNYLGAEIDNAVYEAMRKAQEIVGFWAEKLTESLVERLEEAIECRKRQDVVEGVQEVIEAFKHPYTDWIRTFPKVENVHGLDKRIDRELTGN